MKQFLSFIGKEFYHIFRDSRTMLILLVMPIVQIILFGFAISNEVKNLRVAVFDPGNDPLTQRIEERIDANDAFHFVAALHSREEVEEVFRKNRADLVVVVGRDFSNELRHAGGASLQVMTDGSDPNTAQSAGQYMTAILQSVVKDELNPVPGGAASASEVNTPGQIHPNVQLLYNPGMKAAYNFVPGVMGMILMLICAMMTSVSIVREKERGTMEILLVSPVRPILVIFSKAVPYFILSFVNLSTILLLSRYVIHLPIAGSLALLIGVSLLFILVALALGLLISTIVETQMAAMLVSGMVLMMPVMILSGMMFPTEDMPWILQGISHLVPAKWYILAVKKVMIEGLGFHSILRETGILAFMAIVLLAVSIRKFKVRL